MEVIGGAHGVDDDVGEGAGIESLHLDVIAKGGEVAIRRTKLAAAAHVGVGNLLRLKRIHFHRVLLWSVRSGLRVLQFHGGITHSELDGDQRKAMEAFL